MHKILEVEQFQQREKSDDVKFKGLNLGLKA